MAARGGAIALERPPRPHQSPDTPGIAPQRWGLSGHQRRASVWPGLAKWYGFSHKSSGNI